MSPGLIYVYISSFVLRCAWLFCAVRNHPAGLCWAGWSGCQILSVPVLVLPSYSQRESFHHHEHSTFPFVDSRSIRLFSMKSKKAASNFTNLRMSVARPVQYLRIHLQQSPGLRVERQPWQLCQSECGQEYYIKTAPFAHHHLLKLSGGCSNGLHNSRWRDLAERHLLSANSSPKPVP
jgi:hypothetical protein